MLVVEEAVLAEGRGTAGYTTANRGVGGLGGGGTGGAK